ncbi:MAG: hypothetical protein HY926_13380 [Elusimicrobia bacterium]|nr:hypothetical protein [Elusimicrobiota bacterium]
MADALKTLALAVLFAAPASAQYAPVSPAAWDKAALDGLFDGSLAMPPLSLAAPKRGPALNYIIRQEDEKLPPAPRYALNLSGVPPEFRHTVAGFDQLFHKNQEETKEWTDRTNALIRQRNKGRLFKMGEWKYDGRPNEPPYTCLSDAAGTVNDWWALQLGRSLPSHRNANNGSTELGLLDPRLLELKYVERGYAGGGPHYFLLPRLIDKDPVRDQAAPIQPLGYADLLIEPEAYTVEDPYTGERYSYDPSQSAMEGQYKELFSGSIFQGRTPDKYAKVLADGVEKFGIAYVQLEQTSRPRMMGAHAVAVVGYFCMEPGQKLADCAANASEKDWGEKTYFIVHDSFGDFPADKTRDASGGSAYRAVRIESIDQAIVFPHSLLVTARPYEAAANTWQVFTANKGGKPVELVAVHAQKKDGSPVLVVPGPDGSMLIAGAQGDQVLLAVEARHYYEPDGKARVFSLELAKGAVSALELRRTRPTQPQRALPAQLP